MNHRPGVENFLSFSHNVTPPKPLLFVDPFWNQKHTAFPGITVTRSQGISVVDRVQITCKRATPELVRKQIEKRELTGFPQEHRAVSGDLLHDC